MKRVEVTLERWIHSIWNRRIWRIDLHWCDNPGYALRAAPRLPSLFIRATLAEKFDFFIDNSFNLYHKSLYLKIRLLFGVITIQTINRVWPHWMDKQKPDPSFHPSRALLRSSRWILSGSVWSGARLIKSGCYQHPGAPDKRIVLCLQVRLYAAWVDMQC